MNDFLESLDFSDTFENREAGTACLTAGYGGLPPLKPLWKGSIPRIDWSYSLFGRTDFADSMPLFAHSDEVTPHLEKQLGILTVDPLLSRVKRLRKAVAIAAEGVRALHPPKAVERALFATLTYDTRAFNANEIASHKYATPRDISSFIKKVREHYRSYHDDKKLVLTYIWVAELQKRGVLHYHVIFFVPKGQHFPFFDIGMKDRRSKRGLRKALWPHGRCNIKVATSPVGYLIKYASKMDSKDNAFPKGCRMYGMGGLVKDVRDLKRWSMWPSYLRSNCSVTDKVVRVAGGGAFNKTTSRKLISDYELFGTSFTKFIRRRTEPKEFEETPGAFCWINVQSALSNLALVQSGEKP